jgi:hypothetical protein
VHRRGSDSLVARHRPTLLVGGRRNPVAQLCSHAHGGQRVSPRGQQRHARGQRALRRRCGRAARGLLGDADPGWTPRGGAHARRGRCQRVTHARPALPAHATRRRHSARAGAGRRRTAPRRHRARQRAGHGHAVRARSRHARGLDAAHRRHRLGAGLGFDPDGRRGGAPWRHVQRDGGDAGHRPQRAHAAGGCLRRGPRHGAHRALAAAPAAGGGRARAGLPLGRRRHRGEHRGALPGCTARPALPALRRLRSRRPRHGLRAREPGLHRGCGGCGPPLRHGRLSSRLRQQLITNASVRGCCLRSIAPEGCRPCLRDPATSTLPSLPTLTEGSRRDQHAVAARGPKLARPDLGARRIVLPHKRVDAACARLPRKGAIRVSRDQHAAVAAHAHRLRRRRCSRSQTGASRPRRPPHRTSAQTRRCACARLPRKGAVRRDPRPARCRRCPRSPTRRRRCSRSQTGASRPRRPPHRTSAQTRRYPPALDCPGKVPSVWPATSTLPSLPTLTE